VDAREEHRVHDVSRSMDPGAGRASSRNRSRLRLLRARRTAPRLFDQRPFRQASAKLKLAAGASPPSVRHRIHERQHLAKPDCRPLRDRGRTVIAL
jgi:hypothetical protein